MDMDSNSIHISRNVVFHEQIFPYAKEKSEPYEDIFSPAESTSTSSASDGKLLDMMNDLPAEEGSPTETTSNSSASKG